jgi:hypothetical protein
MRPPIVHTIPTCICYTSIIVHALRDGFILIDDDDDVGVDLRIA